MSSNTSNESTPQAARLPYRLPIRIGTAGWSIPGQQAAFFPGEGSHLERYSQVLACAEINSSFYRPHRPSTYTRWAASTPEDFRFSVKAPKAITHLSALAPSRAQLQAFLDEIRHLTSRLGPILFQLPPSQGFEESRIRAFFSLFRELYPDGYAVIEPRHRSWFSLEVDELLEGFRIARVVADPPLADKAFQPSGDQRIIYYRLHGSPRVYYSNYSIAWLKDLATTFRGHQAAREIWYIFDNTASGAAIENALALTRELSKTRPNSPSSEVLGHALAGASKARL